MKFIAFIVVLRLLLLILLKPFAAILPSGKPFHLFIKINCMKFVYTGFCIALMLLCSSVYSQDIFMRVTGPDGTVILGDVITTGFKDYILVYSNSDGSQNCTTGTTCKPVTSSFNFVIAMDRSVNALRKILYTGQPAQRVEVFFRKPTANFNYYKITLEEAFLTSFQEGTSANSGSSDVVQISFNATKVGWTYTPQTSSGAAGSSSKFGWDHTINKEWTSF